MNLRKDDCGRAVCLVLVIFMLITGFSFPDENQLQFRSEQDPILDELVDTIIKKVVSQSSSDYEKILAVHDYLVLNTAYDYDNYRRNRIPRESFTARGALVYGVAVCSGYSYAFQRLLDELGIENLYVSGEAGTGGGHAWNMVKLDGEWYHIDATWNDPVPDRPQRVRYKYFLVSDAKIRSYDPGRTWPDNLPKATCNQFVHLHSTDRVDHDTDLITMFFTDEAVWAEEMESALQVRPTYHPIPFQALKVTSSNPEVISHHGSTGWNVKKDGVSKVTVKYQGLETSAEVLVYSGKDENVPRISFQMTEAEYIDDGWMFPHYSIRFEWTEFQQGLYDNGIYYILRYRDPNYKVWNNGFFYPEDQNRYEFLHWPDRIEGHDFWITVYNRHGMIAKSNEISFRNKKVVEAISPLNRIQGSNRFGTAAEISRNGWSDFSDVVILANGLDYPDALAGSALAYGKDAPVLLTTHSRIPDGTMNEIWRLGPQTIYLLGGKGAISNDQEQTLRNYGFQVKRLSGMNRFETAVSIGTELRKEVTGSTAVIATGRDYPDALAVAPFAAKNGYPLLFTEKNRLPDSTKAALFNWGVKKVYVIGGEGVINDEVMRDLKAMNLQVKRLCGANRFETAVEIVEYFHKGEKENYYIATGMNFADALTGSVLAARRESPIFLTRPTSLPSAVRTQIRSYVGVPLVLGGEGAVSHEVLKELLK